jgi:N6-adenosine-specific RNA methylase IME4
MTARTPNDALIVRDEQAFCAMIEAAEQGKALIARADFRTVMAIRDEAEKLKRIAERHERFRDSAVKLSEVSVRAARRGGEILDERLPKGRSKKVLHGETLSLERIGISRPMSCRWQKLARVPEDRFESYIAGCLEEREPCSMNEAFKLVKEIRRSNKRAAAAETVASEPCEIKDLAEAESKFSTVYADPPWQYSNQSTRAATDDHYGTMTVEDICALPIPGICEEQSLLWLWTTNGFLVDALTKVIPAWGFEFKSMVVWCKPQMGIGNYVRVSHELLLIATRGGLRPDGKNQKSWIVADREKHSAKPNVFREMVEQISPGPRIELFAREARPGWTAWGNQISRQKFLEPTV